MVGDIDIYVNNIIALSPAELDLVRMKLTQAIDHLLKTNFAKLQQIAYRIDIDETKFTHALTSTEPAVALANLIIERQIQKYHARVKNG